MQTHTHTHTPQTCPVWAGVLVRPTTHLRVSYVCVRVQVVCVCVSVLVCVRVSERARARIGRLSCVRARVCACAGRLRFELE